MDNAPPASDEPQPIPPRHLITDPGEPGEGPASFDAAAPTPEPEAEAPAAPDEGAHEPPRPAYGIGSIVRHPTYGRGRVQAYDGNAYVILFKGGELRIVSFGFAGLDLEEREGDPELDRLKEAVREVLSDYGWLDSSIELGGRWQGGAVILEPGRSGTQAKEIPMDAFFKKLIGVREKLRVLEQKINNHPSLNEEEKLELDAYITRCYGSLTTFNALFDNKASHFVGTGKRSE